MAREKMTNKQQVDIAGLSPASVGISMAEIVSTPLTFRTEIQLEIPDLAPTKCLKVDIVRKTPLSRKSTWPEQNAQVGVIDPRQLQFKFVEA